METFLTCVLIIHVVAGVNALLFGLMAFFLRSKTPRHKPLGRIYFWCMTLVFVSALLLALFKTLVFFFFIAVFTYYSVAIAYRAIQFTRLKRGQKPGGLDWFIQIIAGLVFLAAIIYGVFYNRNGGSLLIFIFAGFGIWSVLRNSLLFFRGTLTTNDWLRIHIGHMMGSYIGAITAFLVNQTDHIPVHPLVLWLGPTVMVLPLLLMELRKVKPKTDQESN